MNAGLSLEPVHWSRRLGHVVWPPTKAGRPRLETGEIYLCHERSRARGNWVLGVVMLADGLVRVASLGFLSVNLTGPFALRRAKRSLRRAKRATFDPFA